MTKAILMLITVILFIIHYIYLVRNYHFCAVGSSTKQTPTEKENNRLALIFYRKFLTKPFDQRKLKVGEENTSFKLSKFNVQFKVTDQQLKKLKEAKTAREIDAVVTSIVEQPGTEQIPTEEENYRLALNFHRKFLTRPFDERKLKVDQENISFKLRTFYVQFKVTDQQLRKLKESQTARDIDAVVISIVEQSETSVLHLQYFENFVLKMVSIFKVNTASSGLVETLFIGGPILFLMTVGIMYGLRAVGRLLAVVITITRSREQAADQEDAQHAPAQLPPTVPLNMNKNRPRREYSKVKQTTNRIEKITKGGSEPKVKQTTNRIEEITEGGSEPKVKQTTNRIEKITEGGSEPKVKQTTNRIEETTEGASEPKVKQTTNRIEEITEGGSKPKVKQTTNRIEKITEGGSEPKVEQTTNRIEETTEGASEPKVKQTTNRIEKIMEGGSEPKVKQTTNRIEETTEGASEPKVKQTTNRIEKIMEGGSEPKVKQTTNRIEKITEGASEPKVKQTTNRIEKITEGGSEPKVKQTTNRIEKITEGGSEPKVKQTTNRIEEITEGASEPKVKQTTNRMEEITEGGSEPKVKQTTNRIEKITEGGGEPKVKQTNRTEKITEGGSEPKVKQITNRIEEITEGGLIVAGALVPASVEETSRRKEDVSGDGPVVKDETTDEGASSDEEIVFIQCDVRKDPAKNSTDNQSKTSVNQQISDQNKYCNIQ